MKHIKSLMLAAAIASPHSPWQAARSADKNSTSPCLYRVVLRGRAPVSTAASSITQPVNRPAASMA